MSLPSRLLRLCACLLLAAHPGAAPAQTTPQFVQPQVSLTNGRVTQIVPGNFQGSGLPDILYLNAPVVSGSTTSVTSGLLLNRGGFTNLDENQIPFDSVVAVTAAVADLDDDGHTDFAYALSATSVAAPDLCVYYGTGSAINSGPQFNPIGQKSGCLTLPNPGGQLPHFSAIVAAPFNTGRFPHLFLEDTANQVIDVVNNTESPDNSGTLKGFSLATQLHLPAADGSGPIFTGDFNGDGHTDLLINNQTSHTVHIYFGNGDGTFQAPLQVLQGTNVYSVLLADIDGDGVPDLIIETDAGAIQIFRGYGALQSGSPFAPASIGGTTTAATAAMGNGGQLAAVGDVNGDGLPDILTVTPVGLSVLLGQPPDVRFLNARYFQLAALYNIGPGRASFSLADFNGDGFLDLAVDSPEGVAITLGRGDGTFQTSRAYPAGHPALNAVTALFRNAAENPGRNPDVVTSYGLGGAALLTGDGLGNFSLLSAQTLPFCSTPPCNFWSTVQTADFNGDGNLDLLFTATGLPLPAPGSGSGTGLALAYGLGTGIFPVIAPVLAGPIGAPSTNNFFGAATVANLNGDSFADIASVDESFYDTLLENSGGVVTLGLNTPATQGGGDSNAFAQVAAGYLRSSQSSGAQDLVFQQGADLTPYLNSGDGIHFTPQPSLPAPLNSTRYAEQTVLIADVDGDGSGDVIVPYHDLASSPASPSASNPDLLFIWYGNGDGTFSQPVVTPLSRNFYLAQIADMNNDGRPDLVLSDGFVLGILYNQGNRSFGGEIDYLAGQGINSISIADVNHDGSLDLVLANGGLTISSPIALGGLTQSSLTLTPNPVVDTGGVTVLINNITTRPVTGTLTLSPDPSSYQGAINLSVQLSSSSGVPVPTGTVQFAVNGTNVGSPVAVTPGASSSTATFTIPAGNPYTGSTTLSAAYSGDARNSPVTLYASDAIKASTTSPTTTTLYLCVGPSPTCPTNGLPTPPAPPYPTNLQMYYGQTFNGTAAAFSTDGTSLSTSSSIGFYDAYNGGAPVLLCTLGITPGSSCPPAVGTTLGTAVGTNIFTAVYSGDSTHSSSTSTPVTILVIPDTTSAVLTSSQNPATAGSAVTFTATLTGNIVGPTGQVTFLDGGTAIGTGNLVLAANGTSSIASFTTSSLAVGTHAISASYAATLDFNASTSPIVNQVILPVAVTTSHLSSAPNPSYSGQAVTFTDTVSLASGAAVPVPTGSVTFSDDGVAIGTATLNSAGVATFTTSNLAAGSHTITAVSSGDANTSGSSASVVQVVNALPAPGSVNFAIVVTPSPVSLGVGNTTAVTVTVQSLSGYSENVTLSCSNLPYESTCTFGSTTVATGSSTTLLLSAMAPHTCGTNTPYFVAGSGQLPGGIPVMPAIPALAALGALALPGRRRWLRALMALVAVTAMLQVTGCGTCTDLGTRPATYTLQVAGSGSANGEVESTPVVLNVHL